MYRPGRTTPYYPQSAGRGRAAPSLSVGWKRGDHTMKDEQKPTRTEPQPRKEDQPAQNRGKKEQKKSEQTRS